MTTPKIQKATDAVKRALQSITAADGYTVDLQVIESLFAPTAPGDAQGSDAWQARAQMRILGWEYVQPSPIAHTDVAVTYAITGEVRLSDEAGNTLNELASAVAADIETALMQSFNTPAADGHPENLADTVVNFTPEGAALLEGEDQGLYGFVVTFSAKVRYPIDQPYGE